jgi:transposase
MKQDPLSCNFFVFCNKHRTTIKILYWDNNGFALWYKRLEEDKFRWPKNGDAVTQITKEELGWLLKGLDITSAHKKLNYSEI